MPMPPAPSWLTMRYGPSVVPGWRDMRGAEYIAERYVALAVAETVPDSPKRPHSTRMIIGLCGGKIASLVVPPTVRRYTGVTRQRVQTHQRRPREVAPGLLYAADVLLLPPMPHRTRGTSPAWGLSLAGLLAI